MTLATEKAAIEKRLIEEALKVSPNQDLAAELLGIGLTTLRCKIKKHRIAYVPKSKFANKRRGG